MTDDDRAALLEARCEGDGLIEYAVRVMSLALSDPHRWRAALGVPYPAVEVYPPPKGALPAFADTRPLSPEEAAEIHELIRCRSYTATRPSRGIPETEDIRAIAARVSGGDWEE